MSDETYKLRDVAEILGKAVENVARAAGQRPCP